MSEPTGEKEFDPSPRRLEEARQKGDFVRSADLTTAAAYAGLTLFALTGGAAALITLGQVAKVLVDQPDLYAEIWFNGVQAPLGGLLWSVVLPVLPFFLVPAGAALLCLFAQRALVLTPENIRPKLSRLSPMQGFKNKFGLGGLFEFGKSAVKMVVILIILSVIAPMIFNTATPAVEALFWPLLDGSWATTLIPVAAQVILVAGLLVRVFARAEKQRNAAA